MEFRETLNTGISFRQWMYGNGLEAKYSFAMAWTPRGLQIAPPDFQLEGKTRDEKRKEIEREFGSQYPNGFQFVVEFVPVETREPIRINNSTVGTERVVEMHFGRSACKLEYQPVGKRFYWRTTSEQSDRDEGDLSPKDALKVFAGVSQVALKYQNQYKPDGILITTREDAKDARARIYGKIAGKLAAERGGMVASVDTPLSGSKKPILVWFGSI